VQRVASTKLLEWASWLQKFVGSTSPPSAAAMLPLLNSGSPLTQMLSGEYGATPCVCVPYLRHGIYHLHILPLTLLQPSCTCWSGTPGP
jgi:hypothetical protein